MTDSASIRETTSSPIFISFSSRSVLLTTGTNLSWLISPKCLGVGGR
jgi:hypothetical protein